MANDDADWFRKQAEQAWQDAEKAISPLDKKTWLKVASEWMSLARAADDRPNE